MQFNWYRTLRDLWLISVGELHRQRETISALEESLGIARGELFNASYDRDKARQSLSRNDYAYRDMQTNYDNLYKSYDALRIDYNRVRDQFVKSDRELRELRTPGAHD